MFVLPAKQLHSTRNYYTILALISALALQNMSHQEIHKASPYPMLPVPEALALTLAHTRVMTAHDVDLSRALGLVLAHAVHAADPLPPFPASIKDGYAVVAEVFFSCIYIYIYIYHRCS